MRMLLAVVLPLVVQVLGFVLAWFMSIGGGSFMGLLVIPAAAVALPLLLTIGISGARGNQPLAGLMLTTLLIAVVPPMLLLILRALES